MQDCAISRTEQREPVWFVLWTRGSMTVRQVKGRCRRESGLLTGGNIALCRFLSHGEEEVVNVPSFGPWR